MSQLTSPAVVSSAIRTPREDVGSFGQSYAASASKREAPMFDIPRWTFLQSQNNVVPILDIKSVPQRTTPTSHLKVLRDPLHHESHLQHNLSPALGNTSEMYIRFLEKQYDNYADLLTNPAFSSFIENKSVDEVKQILKWGRHLELVAHSLVLSNYKHKQRDQAERTKMAVIENYALKYSGRYPQQLSCPRERTEADRRLEAIQKAFSAWEKLQPSMRDEGSTRLKMQKRTRYTDPKATAARVAHWSVQVEKEREVQRARLQEEEKADREFQAMFRRAAEVKKLEKQDLEDKERIAAEERQSEGDTADGVFKARSTSPLQDKQHKDEISTQDNLKIPTTTSTQDEIKEGLRGAFNTNIAPSIDTTTDEFPGKAVRFVLPDIEAEEEETTNLLLDKITRAPQTSLFKTDNEQVECDITDWELATTQESEFQEHTPSIMSSEPRERRGAQHLTADNIVDFLNDTTYDSDDDSEYSYSEEDTRYEETSSCNENSVVVSQQQTNFDATHSSTTQQDGSNLLHPGWDLEPCHGQLSRCTWLIYPLSIPPSSFREAAVRSRVPQILLTMPGGMMCEFRERAGEIDMECPGWIQFFEEREDAQIWMELEHAEWLEEEEKTESWSAFMRRENAMNWWRKRPFADLEEERKEKRRRKMLNWEMKVVRPSELDDLSEDEGEESMDIGNVTWKVEHERRFKKQRLDRRDSGYMSGTSEEGDGDREGDDLCLVS